MRPSQSRCKLNFEYEIYVGMEFIKPDTFQFTPF